MSRTFREWMLARDPDIQARLDSIRRAAVSAERASFADIVREILRPNAAAWAALALAWILLAAAHAQFRRSAYREPGQFAKVPSPASLDITQNEALSVLDPRS